MQGFCGKCCSHLYATDPAKTSFMLRTACLDRHQELVPAKHLFGKSAVEWVGEIAYSSWSADEPSCVMDGVKHQRGVRPLWYLDWRA